MRHELVVPHHVLEAALAAMMVAAQRAGAPNPLLQDPPSVALGWASLQAAPQGLTWAALDLSVPAHPGAELLRPAPSPSPEAMTEGLVVLWWVTAADALPREAADWQGQMAAARGQHVQLALYDRRPTLMLAIDATGHVSGMVHSQSRWQPLGAVRVPGSGMRRFDLQPLPGRVLALHDFGQGRYSRLGGALGAPVLQRLQRSLFAIVGTGRTGSSVAGTLVRYGASVLLIDPDIAEAHNAGDGDGMLPALHEGLPKVAALARALSPLLRPGARIHARRLSIDSSTAGHLLGGADMLVSTVDNDAARLWAAAWSAALLLPHLDVGVALPLQGGAGADVRLTLPGLGCLACVGGFADSARLAHGVAGDGSPPNDFREQRRGSARSVGVAAAHLGIRLIEQLYDGRLAGNRFVQLQEDHQTGRLRLDDVSVEQRRICPLCSQLSGTGARGLNRSLLSSLALRAARMRRDPA